MPGIATRELAAANALPVTVKARVVDAPAMRRAVSAALSLDLAIATEPETIEQTGPKIIATGIAEPVIDTTRDAKMPEITKMITLLVHITTHAPQIKQTSHAIRSAAGEFATVTGMASVQAAAIKLKISDGVKDEERASLPPVFIFNC